ncbi:MAG: sensor histidine kinase, partial [Bacteroidota bacterium]
NIRCDGNQMQQVLINLLKNAGDSLIAKKQAEPDFKAVIPVLYEIDDKNFYIKVIDNGDGFPENQNDSLFEPYVTHKPKGTGLGLAIVKKIVEDHDGKIHLHNLSFGGACVTMSFPLSIILNKEEITWE